MEETCPEKSTKWDVKDGKSETGEVKSSKIKQERRKRGMGFVDGF